MEIHSKTEKCRLCESSNLSSYLDFGDCSLANNFLKTLDDSENKIKTPLNLVKCEDCGAFQLSVDVNPDVLFSNYIYSSSTSGSLTKYFKQYALDTVERLNLSKQSKILEIGSNDGVLMRPFLELGYDILGIDPARNIVEKCRNDGLQVEDLFFNSESSDYIKAKYGKFDLIIANNVFAHIPSVLDFAKSVKNILSKNGVYIFENAYWKKSVEGLYFDQIYAEHSNYLTVKPLKKMFDNLGMDIFEVLESSNQGGSIRCFVKLKENTSYSISSNVERFIAAEESMGLYNKETYTSFKQKIDYNAKLCSEFIERFTAKGFTFSCYGAPAKLALLSKVYSLNSKNIQYVVDDSEFKQNLYAPENHIPVKNRDYFIQNPTHFCLITATNFTDLIMKNNEQFNGQWLKLLPKFELESKHFLA